MRSLLWLAALSFTVLGCEFAIPPTDWDAPIDRAPAASGGTSSPAVARLDPVELSMGQAFRYEVRPPRGERVEAVYSDCDGDVRSQSSGAQGLVLNVGTRAASCEVVVELPRGKQFSEAWRSPDRLRSALFDYMVPPESSSNWLIDAANQRLLESGVPSAWSLSEDGWWRVRNRGQSYRAPVWATALRASGAGLEFFCTDGTECIETCADASCGRASGAEASRIFAIPDAAVREAARVRLLEVRRRALEQLVGESTDPDRYLMLLSDTFHLYHPTGLGVNAGDDAWVFELNGVRYAAAFGAMDGGAVDGRPALVCRDGTDCILTSGDGPVGAVPLGLDPTTPPEAYQTIARAFAAVERLAEERGEADLARRDSLADAVLQSAQAQAARADSLARALTAETPPEPSADEPEARVPESPQWRTVEGALDGTQGVFQLSPDHTGPAVTYELELNEGDTLYVEMLSSDFDPFLTLADMGGYVLHNDDLGFALDAGFRYVVPASGAYGILAGSASPDARGGFTLRLRTESP